MPVYDFVCSDGHVTESRQGVDTTTIPCRCGSKAGRVAVYENQYTVTETGAKNGRRGEVPRDERRYGRQVSEYIEASEEVAYQYAKADEEVGRPVKRPNLWGKGLAAAKKKGAKLNATV